MRLQRRPTLLLYLLRFVVVVKGSTQCDHRVLNSRPHPNTRNRSPNTWNQGYTPVIPARVRYTQLLCCYGNHDAMSLAEMATSAGPSNVVLKRLEGVEGIQEQSNDLIYCKKKDGSFSGSVIFFGGDVQDVPEKMLAHRDNGRYVAWNLEATAEILSIRFPGADIWVILPHKRVLQTFSIFSNFMNCDDLGNPEHSEGQLSWNHLANLWQNARKQIDSPGVGTEVRLVGFSKGCVVLNQLLYDLGAAKVDENLKEFVTGVQGMYWLDGGHNGGGNTWINDVDVLQNLVGLDMEVFSHVTPYQVRDVMRKWLGKEQKKFVEKLKKLGVKVTNTIHFEDEDRSLENHFNVLKVF